MLTLLLACAPTPTSTAMAAVDDLTWVDTGERAAPLSLTAADGTGLELKEMHVEAVVDGPLAFTELHLVFHNPEPRTIEGRFEITLPTGAAISRFAMKLDDHWQEGEVVELQAARRAYEDFLHRRTDPALLEFDAGNEFRARVFPIPANGDKEIRISWSHDLDVGEPWSLPTGGLPELGLMTAAVTLGGETFTMRTEYQVPEGDLSLGIDGPDAVALRGEDTSIVRIVPDLDVPADPVKNATVLVDTSASRALSMPDVIADLLAIVPTFGGEVRILAFDQAVVEIYRGKARDLGPGDLTALKERGAMGASDLSVALEAVGDASRVVAFTDGVLTAGRMEGSAVRDQLAKSGIERMDVVLRGGARDEAAAADWVGALPRDGVVLDADLLDSGAIARRLGLGTAGVVELSVPGADWIWPTHAAGLQPGDTLTVYADLPRTAALDLKVDGESVGRIPEESSNGPLLVRASAQAEIQALQARERRAGSPEEREQIAQAIVEVSTTHRVLSPHTALLVLETEADYERFDIPRNALTDILVIEDGDLTWLARKKPVFTSDSSNAEVPTNENRVSDEPEAAPQKPKKASAPARERRQEARPSRRPSPRPRPDRRPYAAEEVADMELDMSEEEEDPTPRSTNPRDAWSGDYLEVMIALEDGKLDTAAELAKAWRLRAPGDPLALLALGQVLEAQEKLDEAARAYGSLIDLFPSRADLRRLAGQRLEAIGTSGLPLATDTYRVAVSQRPDHPSGHRMLAWALAKSDDHAGAIATIEAALKQDFGRFEAAHRILKEDAALIAAAWKGADPGANVEGALDSMGVKPATGRAIRFVLSWETDANDVDFHIYDAKKGHAFYSNRDLPSGGSLYADITSGYGPECFAIDKPNAFPYTLQAHYYSQGPMGFGMGKLQVIEHDGKGTLHFEERPFVVMTDGAYVALGTIEKSAFPR